MTIRLESRSLVLECLPEAGGNLLAFRAKGKRGWVDLMQPATPEAAAARDPQGMACFSSIPYVSRISNGSFGFDGRKYDVPPNQPPSIHPLHGYVWRNPGEVIEESKDHFIIGHDSASPDYPFHFRSTQHWELVDGKVAQVTLSVENTGKRAMPFGLGLHPFFLKTPDCRLQAHVKTMIVNDENVMPVRVEPVKPEQDFSKKARRLAELDVDNCFTGWDQFYTIEWPEHGIGLNVKADPVFRFLVVCAPADTDWFCVNPVSHYNDAFNNPLKLQYTGLESLKPGQSMGGSVRFRLT